MNLPTISLSSKKINETGDDKMFQLLILQKLGLERADLILNSKKMTSHMVMGYDYNVEPTIASLNLAHMPARSSLGQSLYGQCGVACWMYQQGLV